MEPPPSPAQVLKSIEKAPDKLRRLTSWLRFRALIERTLVDLSANIENCVHLISKLEKDSMKRNPLLMENIKQQLYSLKETLINEEDLAIDDVVELIEQCQLNLSHVVTGARDINVAPLQKFIHDLNETITTCDELLKGENDLYPEDSSKNQFILDYVSKISNTLKSNVAKLDKYEPIQKPPKLPDFRTFIDNQRNSFDIAAFCNELENIIAELDKKQSAIKPTRESVPINQINPIKQMKFPQSIKEKKKTKGSSRSSSKKGKIPRFIN